MEDDEKQEIFENDDLTAQEKSEIKAADELYNELATVTPQRNVVMPSNTGMPKSMDEEEETGVNDTDFEKFLRKLFPVFPFKKLKTVCAAVMVGRVLYDSMLDQINLTVSSIVEDWDDRPIDEGGDGVLHFQTLLDLVTVAYQIGLDSKGRVDIQEGLGAAETRKLSDVANQFG
jgi:hypothetical protein